MKKILFVSHDASRSGAPLVLLEIVKRLQRSNKYHLKVLFLNGGEKLEDFELLCETEILQHKKENLFKKINRKIFNSDQIIQKLNNEKFDLLYINSMASFVFLPGLEFLKVNKTLLHMHESGNFPYYSDETFQKVAKKANKIICVSDLVKKYLVSSVDFNLNDIAVIYPCFIDTQSLSQPNKNFEMESKPFIIGGCGNYSLTKGLDLFISVASNFYKMYGTNISVEFLWLGDSGYKEVKYLLDRDIKRLGLESKIKILPKTNKPLDIFEKFNLFFLSSREEAFGLAAFENGLLGNPIICFKNASGISELIESQNTIAPYLDVESVTKLVWELFNDREFLQTESEQICKTFNKILQNDDLKNIEKLISELIS